MRGPTSRALRLARHLTTAAAPSYCAPVRDLALAAQKLSTDGFVRVEVGAAAPIHALESAARRLMGLGEAGGGSYNGGGGVMRSSVAGSSFLNGSAGAPAELPVQFHNEMAYSTSVPKALAFAMLTQAGEGGVTTLADNVEVTRLMSESIKRKLRLLGVQYIRNLNDESERDAPDFFTSWQGAFQTADMEEALRQGNAEDSILTQIPGSLRLRHVAWSPVFIEHPAHGELYFSSILNRHGSWLDNHHAFGQMPLQQRPYHCVWGDGSEFSEEELQEIRGVHEQCTKKIRLEQGDLLVMDNLRVAHGRTSYAGDRLIGLLLSDMIKREYRPPAAFRASLQAS